MKIFKLTLSLVLLFTINCFSLQTQQNKNSIIFDQKFNNKDKDETILNKEIKPIKYIIWDIGDTLLKLDKRVGVMAYEILKNLPWIFMDFVPSVEAIGAGVLPILIAKSTNLITRSNKLGKGAISLMELVSLGATVGLNLKNLDKIIQEELFNFLNSVKYDLSGECKAAGNSLPMEHGSPMPDIRKAQFCGEITSEEILKILDKNFEIYKFKYESLRPIIKNIIDWMFSGKNFGKSWTANADLLPILKKLHENKYEFIIISNNDKATFEGQFNNEPNKEMFSYFKPENIFLSSDLHDIKPNPKLFKKVLELIKATPEECVLIDDEEVNCKIASQMGMHVINVGRKDRSSLPKELKKLGISLD